VVTIEYGVMDLVDACVEAHARRHDETEAGRRHQRRARALADAFGLRAPPRGLESSGGMALPTSAEHNVDESALPGLLEACIQSQDTLVTPFQSYLEGPDPIIALYQRFGRRLNELEASGDSGQFRIVLDEMTVAVAALLWHLDEAATVRFSVNR